MRWFRRPGPPDVPRRPDPAAMIDDLDRFINRSSGGLPGWAVVEARWITDTLRAVLATPPVEVTTEILVTGTAGDYLPTTLRGSLAVGDEL
ncbi:hypothetical protein, partial [Actinoplanes philippinensis]|uniref:hypothetical protein n=1 Tax=Actinoplanes philippinensis TaxID=35752 RepID=UPI0033D53319